MPAPPRLVVLVALPLLWLTACSDSDAEPNPEPAPTATEATLEPEPSEPSIPAAAQGTDEASAKAFVRHYVGLISYAEATGNTKALREATSPACTTCGGLLETIDSNYANGGSMDSEGWSVRRLNARRLRNTEFVVSGKVTIGSSVVHQSDGSTKQFDAATQLASFRLRHGPSGWTTKGLEFVA